MPDIKSTEIHLWVVEGQQITEQAMLDEYQALLNSEEQKRFDRFVFPKHKKQFLISRALLRSVIGQYLNQQPESLVFARNAYGKPRIASFEQSLPISFNLSHTNDLSVLAVVLDNDLGVDAEYFTRKVDILKLAERFFSKQEYSELATLDVKKYDERFFKLWTLKEAYIKACGMGLAIPLRDFSFNFSNKGFGVSFDEVRDDNPELWQFWEFVYKNNFQVALALKLKKKEALKKIVIQQGRPLDKFSTFKLAKLNHSA